MPRVFDTMLSPGETRARILALAEVGEPIAVSLGEAMGLVMAEPAIADVAHPPFDRSTRDGYAVRSADAAPGALLRVAGVHRPGRDADAMVEAGEAIRLSQGDPIPEAADAVLPLGSVRADPDQGPARVIEVLRPARAGRGVAPRGSILEAGAELAPAGTRLRPSMVGLLASQGVVHPLCHRRVRVSILAVGQHLIGPAEEPAMHRERNAANLAIVALADRLGAAPHDLQSVPGSRLIPALERATNAPVVVVLGPPTVAIRRSLDAMGVEILAGGVALRPGGRSKYGVIRDESGRVAHHVFHLPIGPIAAVTAFTLLVRPLIEKLQGLDPGHPGPVPAALVGGHRATGDRAIAVPVSLSIGDDARHQARPLRPQGPDDLPALARADGLALLPANSGPWSGGELIEVIPFAPPA